jgi:hypothetical protein
VTARRLPRLLALLPLCVVGIAASSHVPWEDLTPADALHDVLARFTTLEGHRVYYPTPSAELATALAARSEPAAARELAEARFALGERPAAIAALSRWAEAEGPEAWAEAARWAAERGERSFAFEAAERALEGLPDDDARALHDEQIQWADRHPEAADAVALRRARMRAFPEDAVVFEDYLRALASTKRFEEADALLAQSRLLDPERRLMLRSDLLADRGDLRGASEILESGVDAGYGPDFARAFSARTDRGAPERPALWRTRLTASFDAAALTRLASYFQGQGRGDAAADLLRQIERRDEAGLGRGELQLLARLWSQIDAIPEAFRCELAAASVEAPPQPAADLARLARLALRAGGRPLAWGVYNDEPHRWAARLDRTPGFWTGGLSLLLTGQDWKEALARLESESVPERTFATARLLHDELVRRFPDSPELPGLRAAIMERHVERGEGREALALLPLVEAAGGEAADEARRVALLALRQVAGPVAEELRLFRARLTRLAPDGSKPSLAPPAYSEYEVLPEETWRRPAAPSGHDAYRQVLEEAVGRLDDRDPSHSSSMRLLLGEMDRLPGAETLWLDLARRLESWNLDDELGPRYEKALDRFRGASSWGAAARWYARRSRHAELDRLARQLAAGFRGADIFERANAASVRLEIPEQPRVGQRVRLAPWADWVRLQALVRFPHSARVYREARNRLQRRSAWDRELSLVGAGQLAARAQDSVVVDDALLDERGWATLFADAAGREEFFGRAMQAGNLETRLGALEQQTPTPVRDQFLFEGWARLSRFEAAAAGADRLSAAYPGDEALAQRVLSLHRSLAGLDPAHAGPARALVERTARAVVDPARLWTELGELEEDAGRPGAAQDAWQNILDREARDPDRVSELATLLWDYGHMKAALDVVERGRERLARPRFFAFEAGVLREENHDIRGAVLEYLSALLPESGSCYCSAFEADQRSLRRLAQLLGRSRVRTLVEDEIAGLVPGRAEDERRLAALLPLATIEAPEPGLGWDADDWIDAMDMPSDLLGRATRETRRAATRPDENAGIREVADALLARAEVLLPAATTSAFADALEGWARPLLAERDAVRAVSFEAAAMARRAALAASAEDRVSGEIALARFLVRSGRAEDADAVWSALGPRVEALPEGAARMHAEAARAEHLESLGRIETAGSAWQALSLRYPWSSGVLHDRVAFLNRVGRGVDARRVLETAVPAMAAGHREAFLEQLTRDSLEAGDRVQARRSVALLLGEQGLDSSHRLGADHLLARLLLKEDADFDPASLVVTEGPRLPQNLLPDLYAQLAQASEREQAFARATSLWIEALNRRLERGWLASAGRAASRAHKLDELRGFFEAQQRRSPRDVRWAVAVREIRRMGDDSAGAIEAAKAAVAVKPDRESLWREAVDLMVRGDRVGEAADYLEGWNVARPADESVAAWRGQLYAQVGDGHKALAIERAALLAFARERPREQGEREERTARAARRLFQYGYPKLALRLIAPSGETAKLAASRLSDPEKARLALANNQFLRLLRDQPAPEFGEAAAAALRDAARPEQREEAAAWFVRRLFPTPESEGDPARLEALWPTVEGAGLERAVRLAVAERLAGRTPGPWRSGAPTAFLEDVGRDAIIRASRPGARLVWQFAQPPWEALWVADLVRRDRPEELARFLDARLTVLLSTAAGPLALPADPESAFAWTRSVGNRAALETWARGLRTRPESVRELAAVFSQRRSWNRLWTMGAKRWDVAPLVALLPDAARGAWFRFWQAAPATPRQADADTRVSLALGRLVRGEPDAASDPLVVRLRGPRTVGESLDKGGQWRWPEFGSTPELWPTRLWGDQAGDAWFALETLARLRTGEADAALVPLEVPQRGREAERAALATRLALQAGDNDLALALLATRPAADASSLAMRLRLLASLGRTAEAGTLLAQAARREQPTLNEDRLRSLEALAADLKLQAPLESLDPGTALPPALLAYLHDSRGATLAERFRTDDPVGFRAALARRYEGRDASLDARQVRFVLGELWARGAGELPRAGLDKLGGLWPHAASWLARQAPADRSEALAAVAALPGVAALEELSRRRGLEQDDVTRLLLVRSALARNDEAGATGLFNARLTALGQAEPLTFGAVEVAAEDEEMWEEGEDWDAASDALEVDALTALLEAWRQPFVDAHRAALVDRTLQAFLCGRRDDGPVPLSQWRLALRIVRTADERQALGAALEHAWLRGDWSPAALQGLVEMLAEQAPELAPRWLMRWPSSTAFDQTLARARILARLDDAPGAARLLASTRPRVLWSASDEVRGFDAWRRLVEDPTPPDTPAAWAQARPFWQGPAADAANALEIHLRAHPLDLLAARAVLRSLAPAPEEALQRARVALSAPALESLGRTWADDALVRLRLARGLFAASARAARTALDRVEANGLADDLVRRRFRSVDVNAALADVARLAASTGEAQTSDALLSVLAERRAPGLVELRAEIASRKTPQAAPAAFRLEGSAPRPWRPRDLDWSLVARILEAEARP